LWWFALTVTAAEPVLMQVGSYSFDVTDFEFVYHQNRTAGRQTIDECMALYITCKLKIVAARDAGLDTLPEIIHEWTRCRDLVAAKGAVENHLLDGLLLFAMTDSVVWSRATRDTVGLQAFYKKNARAFKWEKRMDATIYYCSDEKVADRLSRMVKNKNEGKGKLPNGLFTFFCGANGVSPCVDTVRLMLPKGANTVADRIKWKKGCSKILNVHDKYVFLDVHFILRPTRKTFEEARGIAVSEYQKELERQWIEQLKLKYPVMIDEMVWADLKKKYAE
jgi:hypothetical protein